MSVFDILLHAMSLPKNKAGVMVALPGLTKRRAAEKELCLRGV
jgi:GH24 family phage-related lysozyme (muramidase)